MRATGRRRGLRISAASLAAVAAVLAVVLPLSLRAPAAAPEPEKTAVGRAHTAAANTGTGSTNTGIGAGSTNTGIGAANTGVGPSEVGLGAGSTGAGSSITGGAGRLPNGRGDTVCGDVRFDKAELPGRTATPDNGDWPTAAAADLLHLRGWPRAVPYDITRWTVVLEGDYGVLVAFLPGSGFHYLPIHKAAGGGWSVGRPCTPS